LRKRRKNIKEIETVGKLEALFVDDKQLSWVISGHLQNVNMWVFQRRQSIHPLLLNYQSYWTEEIGKQLVKIFITTSDLGPVIKNFIKSGNGCFSFF